MTSSSAPPTAPASEPFRFTDAARLHARRFNKHPIASALRLLNADQRITHPNGGIALLTEAGAHARAEAGRLDGLRGLRLLVSGSAPLDPVLFERIAAEAGQPPVERYGMTETVMLTSNAIDDRVAGCVGRPLPGVEVRLGDGGAVEVHGPNVFRGYWERPDATAAAFTDEERRVHPAVARVPGLDPRIGAEVLIGELGPGAVFDGAHHRRVHFEKAEILHVEKSPVGGDRKSVV